MVGVLHILRQTQDRPGGATWLTILTCTIWFPLGEWQRMDRPGSWPGRTSCSR
jgi:hypothetical protein